MGFPSLRTILLREDESGQNQTLAGEGRHPLRSQLCHQLTSYSLGMLPAMFTVESAASGISSSMADCMGDFAWEISGYPCGDGWL